MYQLLIIHGSFSCTRSLLCSRVLQTGIFLTKISVSQKPDLWYLLPCISYLSQTSAVLLIRRTLEIAWPNSTYNNILSFGTYLDFPSLILVLYFPLQLLPPLPHPLKRLNLQSVPVYNVPKAYAQLCSQVPTLIILVRVILVVRDTQPTKLHLIWKREFIRFVSDRKNEIIL